jgi:tetratricopeptide (TPR) repeat protein
MMRNKPLLVIACCIAVLVGGAPDARSMIAVHGSVGGTSLPPHYTEARAILELLYNDRPDSARILADEFVANHPDDPFPLLMIARVMRETMSDQDDDKKLIEAGAKPIMAYLNSAIELCDSALESRDADPIYNLYRGWAWMFKAQLDALSANYWGAGRSAKKGKGDLERYLALHPDDPDASGILGTFLYFADTLPAALKIIKSLFLMPGGDSKEGLRLLNHAASHEGILTVDHRIILAAVYTVFEGRFEDGTKLFTGLLDRYPSYVRLVEPIGMLASFLPGEIHEVQDLETRMIARHAGGHAADVDEDMIERIRYHLLYSYMFFNPPEQAIRGFVELANDNPKRPDWLQPLSMMNLGVIFANTGQKDKARQVFQTIISSDAMDRFHDVAGTMLDHLDDGEGMLNGVYPRLVGAIYDARLSESRSLIQEFIRANGENVYSDFYRGEIELLAANRADAEAAYRSALDRSVAPFAQVYQMMAAIRIAEIRGAEKDYRGAAEMLDRALKYYHKEFLVDMLIKGRKRFYKGLADGSFDSAPAFLLPGTTPILPASLLEH